MESLVHLLLTNALAATVLAIVAVVIGRACRRPALTHSLWVLVLVKLITPPLVPLSLPGVDKFLPVRSGEAVSIVGRADEPMTDRETSIQEPATDAFESDESRAVSIETAQMVAATEPESAGPAEASAAIDLPYKEGDVAIGPASGWAWKQPVLAVMITGALAWWALAALRIMRFQRLLQDVRPARGELQAETDELAERMGLNRKPLVCLVPGRVPPMLWAIGGPPRLLVPSELWATMEEDARTSLLLHELAHLKRRDHWIRWLELIVAGLYWWHPVVWWARHALREAEEQCCDAWVVWAMPRRARTYAAALLTAVEFVSGARTAPAAASATSGSGHVACLKRRLTMIVRANTPKGLSWAGRIVVLGLATMVLPLAPSWAENDQSAAVGLNNRPTSADEPRRGDESEAGEPALGRADQSFDDQLLALLTQDGKKAKEAKEKLDEAAEDMKEQARDAAEHFQEQLTDLIGKLGKQFGPVTEEIRKALDRAVGEVHKSLDKENLSVEELGKALEKSQDELKKAFEGGGPVDKELREAIEKSRKDFQDALERGKNEVQGQVDTLRQKSRELTDQARENLDRARGAVEKEGEHDELEAARKEIRDLEQQLRNATRRLELMQRRGPGRNLMPRRERNARGPARPETPSADARPAEPPKEPAEPPAPARPNRPELRRDQTPRRPGNSGGRRAPQNNDSERRIEGLEQKMKSLLKELETIKKEKAPDDDDKSVDKSDAGENR
jgi:bla regulator protein BlaR1